MLMKPEETHPATATLSLPYSFTYSVHTSFGGVYLSRLRINSESHSASPLKRTKREIPFSPLEWTLAISLELKF